MGEVAVKLTNKRKIPMMLPDGQGNTVNLGPGESKIVWGDLEYFRRMPGQGLTGLVVKLEKGKVRLLEDKRKKDVGLFRITNHRKIPMLLATGVDRRKHVEIGPGATVEVVARESVVKQMTGISVRALKPITTPPPKRKAPKPPPPARKAPATLTEDLAKTPPFKVPEVSDTPPPPAPLEEKPETDKVNAAALKGAVVEDDKTRLRAKLGLPDTREEWEAVARDRTWHDLRGAARELGIRGRGREQLTKNIGDEVYGEQ